MTREEHLESLVLSLENEAARLRAVIDADDAEIKRLNQKLDLPNLPPLHELFWRRDSLDSLKSEAAVGLSDGVDLDKLADEIEANAADIDGKIQSYCWRIADARRRFTLYGGMEEAIRESVNDAASAMHDRAVGAADEARRLTERMQLMLLTLPDTEKALRETGLQAGPWKLRIKVGSVRVEVLDMNVLPPEYMRQVPATWEPDKPKIKEALKGGASIPGVSLESGADSLVIR